MKQLLSISLFLMLLIPVSTNAQVWTWIGGSPPPTYGSHGERGEESPSYNPPSGYDRTGITDTEGNIWLLDSFGLWKYNIATGYWAWMGGFQTPYYGNQGEESRDNIPRARIGASSWLGSDGNLWVFGGLVFPPNNPPSLMNDLWRYNISTGNWTWMNGSSTFNEAGESDGPYDEDDTYTPCARAYAATWSDNDGNLWLCGGDTGSGGMSDLWRYNILTKRWAYIKGPKNCCQVGEWGNIGEENAATNPPPTIRSVTWTDDDGNLWLLPGSMSNLWKYVISNNCWIWMSGPRYGMQYGLYGNIGVGASTNLPGSRHSSVGMKDADGNFWLYGGIGFSNSGFGRLGDLWKYERPTSSFPYGIWTWMHGTQEVNQNGVEGLLGIPNASNTPGSRTQATGWGSGGRFWLFGGIAPNPNSGLHDFWRCKLSNSSAPTASCKDVTLPCSAIDVNINDGSTDPDGDKLIFSQDPPGPYPIGTTNVTLTVMDEYATTSSCSGSVTVTDDTSPTVIPKDISVHLDETGHASIIASQIDDGSYDACGIASMTVNPNSFTCANIGGNTVVLTVTDMSGKSASGTATVNVDDITPPVITVPTASLVMPTPYNHAYQTYNVSDFVASATDNCSSSPELVILSISSDEPESGGSCGNTTDDILISADCKSTSLRKEHCNGHGSGSGANGRVYTILMRATDASGNSSEAIYQVVVPKHPRPIGDDGPAYTVNSVCYSPKAVSFSGVLPAGYSLEQNYPNPFNPTTSISYEIPEDAYALLRVFDTYGRVVTELVNSPKTAGAYTVDFDGGTLPSGVYFYRLEANGVVVSRSMMLLK
jgi:hypothetical protein